MKAYRAFGEDGLKRSRAQQTYSFEFKRSAVECYLSTEASYQEVAIALGLNNPTLLARWTKEYRLGGVDALRPKPKGRAPTMPRKMKERPKDLLQDETAQQLKALQDENLKLRIENAYLKELRRLRLQEEMQSKRQGSSAASEENFS
ncbi:transposase [Selenomonas noxia]|uniref:transposase n=1 Tax=Selenomonas noxia TaxID=135083 RepID=UPI003C711AEE